MNVIVLVLLSGVLSFVVLYNLTNINISERIRELSTVKVLGFFDNEVSMYVSRENILLTIFGIILGYGAGWGLLSFILNQATTSQVVFPGDYSLARIRGSHVTDGGVYPDRDVGDPSEAEAC